MTHVFHRKPKSTLPVAVAGDGIEIVDQDGKRYIDACGGAAVSCLGHSHPDVIQAIKDQLDQFAYAHTGFFTNQPAEELATFLAERAPGDLDHVYFLSGGSEAVESALKLARQYFVERGEPRSEKHTSELQSRGHLVCRLLLEKKNRRTLCEPHICRKHDFFICITNSIRLY